METHDADHDSAVCNAPFRVGVSNAVVIAHAPGARIQPEVTSGDVKYTDGVTCSRMTVFTARYCVKHAHGFNTNNRAQNVVNSFIALANVYRLVYRRIVAIVYPFMYPGFVPTFTPW